MSFPNHGLQSVIIQSFICPKWYFLLIAFYLGMRADIEKIFYGESWNDYSGKYKQFHKLNWKNLAIPYQNLHILEDYYTHDHIKGGWKWWTIYVEIFSWTVMISYIGKLIL